MSKPRLWLDPRPDYLGRINLLPWALLVAAAGFLAGIVGCSRAIRR